jgi:hypothetical protein
MMNVQDMSAHCFFVGKFVCADGTMKFESLMEFSVMSPSIGIAFENHPTNLTRERFFTHVIYTNMPFHHRFSIEMSIA